jgi:hypothetical protein
MIHLQFLFILQKPSKNQGKEEVSVYIDGR